MRDPKRIDRILDKIRVIWEKYPDMRLGQLLLNVERGEGIGSDLWNVEDEVWEKKLHIVSLDGFSDEFNRIEKLVKDINEKF